MSELLKNLESNNPVLVEESKNELIKSFSQTKENWLVYGLMDHFYSSNSIKVVEILVKAPIHHDTHIFDKLSEWITINDKRNHAFKLFWLVVQKHPSWLYRVANHRLFREMLCIVKTQRNINTTLHGLFCIIILLPIIPALMNDHLQDLFSIFICLSNWKATNSPELVGNQPIYLQDGIERLFQRLYGMYPCNFIKYLRENINENTMKLVESLVKNSRAHPMLLFSNLEVEKNISRWKEMEPHDIVYECEKFSLDNAAGRRENIEEHSDTPWYGQSFQMAVNQTTSTDRSKHTFAPISTNDTNIKAKVRSGNKWDSIWSPSSAVLATPPPTNNLAISHTPTPIVSQNYVMTTSQQYSSGASPPEAAVEATPETTPLRDFVKPHRPFPVNSNAARTIWSNSSQPSSPLKREEHFRYSEMPASNEKFFKMMIDRNEEKHRITNIDNIEIQNPLTDNENSVNCDLSKEDEEVTQINKQKSIRSTELRSSAEKDVRSRQNFMKYHEMKSMEDSSIENEIFSMQDSAKNSLCAKGYLHSDNAKDNHDKETTILRVDDNCTIETQTDITMPIAWSDLLDKYVETSLKRHSTHEPSSRADMELQLLYLQLQYERYRREVYAERNRRLLGKSRDNVILKTDIEKLKSQLESLLKEHSSMIKNMNEAKVYQICEKNNLSTECSSLREEIQIQNDANKNLQSNVESLDRRLAEEAEEKKKVAGMLETAQAEIFDLKNLLRQYQYQAEVGIKCKEELERLQNREILMNEMKQKCGEKLIELENLRAREFEINYIKKACIEEVKELKQELAVKSSQLDASKERIQNIESQLLRQNSLVADQKRCLKVVKEEYEEKLKAVETKYIAQKAIILRMEEFLLDPCKYRSNANSEPDKSETVGSLDHASPLSMSLASSEGMSWSKPVTEIKNLTHLLDNNSTTVFSTSFNGEASPNNRLPEADDML